MSDKNKGIAQTEDKSIVKVHQIKIKILHENKTVRRPYDPNMKLIVLIDYLKQKFFPDLVFYLIGDTMFGEHNYNQTLIELKIKENESLYLIRDDDLISDDFEEKLSKIQDQQEAERKKHKRTLEILEEQQSIIIFNSDKISGAVKVHGRIQIAFLVDGTKSMDPYAEIVMSTVETIAEQVQFITKRSLLWSAIVYQDYSERGLNGGYYNELRITNQPRDIIKFVNSHTFIGGEDVCEDLKGGLNQALNLKWVEKNRVIVVVCDAPCHGRDYNGGCEDFHPNESILDVLREIIMKDIVLVMVTFNNNTKAMITKFKQIFQQYCKYPDAQFMHLDAMSLQTQQLPAMIKIVLTRTISDIAINQSTKSINQDAQTIQANFYSELQLLKFDQKIQSTCRQFDLLTISIINKDLNTIICKPNIKDLKITQQATWKMNISNDPFNSGSVRNVYLLKKEGSTELYVSKCPRNRRGFQTLEDALKDCLVHVIAQEAFSQFQSQLNQLIQNEGLIIEQNQPKGLPEAYFAQLVILKESDTCFWIAERYISGRFVKFNSNQGYINDDFEDRWNLLAQAFTMFTYGKTLNNSLICDIQGIIISKGICYYTDPAILTANGKSTSTDIGQQGIDAYLTTYQKTEKPGELYLEHLTI